MTTNQENTDSSADSTGRPTRRGLLKLAAVGVGGAGLAVVTGANPAAAADGQPVILGTINDSAGRTTVETSAAGQIALRGYNLATSGSGIGLYGDSASPSGTGVVGLGAATGVEGSSSSGTGVVGSGAVTGVQGSSSSGTGVYGTGAMAGVKGSSSSGIGVSGSSSSGTGTYGGGSAAGVWAEGFEDTTPAVYASGSGLIRMEATQTAPPVSGFYYQGSHLFSDDGSGAWVCVTSGTPGVWRKLAGSATAGALHAISPQRVFDSHHSTKLTSGHTVDVSIADGIDSAGTVTAADLVPAGATAIALNLTVTVTSGTGHLIVWPQGDPKPLSTAISWFGTGQSLTNGFTVAVSTSRKISVFCAGGGSAQFSIDVTGYYL